MVRNMEMAWEMKILREIEMEMKRGGDGDS
jgi:hypothetical protein